MALHASPIVGSPNGRRVAIDQLDGGESTRTFPHLLPINRLAVASNVVFTEDGLLSKRPGNINYGGGSGATGSGSPILSMTRFSSATAGTLLVHSGTQLWKGTDGTGAFASVGTGLTGTQGAFFEQAYDPDMTPAAADALIICDGVRIPYEYDGVNFSPMTAANLPRNRGGVNPITPLFVKAWGPQMVYAGDPTEPTGIYISDVLRPQRFTGNGFVDSQGQAYQAYYPAGRSGRFGVVTGIEVIDSVLLVFYTSAIVAVIATGSYGAFQFQFKRISSTIGCKSPRSIVAFPDYIIFFGGDRFYATDGSSVVPIPDLLPSVYSQLSILPPEIANVATVFAVRRGPLYIASYDAGSGHLERIVHFNTAANGGYYYGQPLEEQDDGIARGGAWSHWFGMAMSAAVECRGPGDSFQLFWGSATGDLVAQHDPPGVKVYSDFGAPIKVEVRTKSIDLGRPTSRKTVQNVTVLGVYNTLAQQYTDAVTPYVVTDSGQVLCNTVQPTITNTGTAYGVKKYGSFLYESTYSIEQIDSVGYPQQQGGAEGTGFQVGCIESSTNPFNIIGFSTEVTDDEPQPH